MDHVWFNDAVINCTGYSASNYLRVVSCLVNVKHWAGHGLSPTVYLDTLRKVMTNLRQDSYIFQLKSKWVLPIQVRRTLTWINFSHNVLINDTHRLYFPCVSSLYALHANTQKCNFRRTWQIETFFKFNLFWKNFKIHTEQMLLISMTGLTEC